MIQMVYLDPRFEKQMRLLRRAGKKASLAAGQADAIIDQLRAGRSTIAQAGTITRHGELRIKGCIKYDLGGGYRLVTLKRDQGLFILYIGTHDDCNRWIENNRDLPIEMIQQRSQMVSAVSPCNDRKCSDPQPFDLDLDDGDFTEELDDRHLRIIFSGLVQSNRTPS